MACGKDSSNACAQASEQAQRPLEWADQIKRAWAQGGANTLTLARVVLLARRHLQHGERSRLWESGRLPFSRRKAQMLLVIAERLDWVNVQTFAQMPQGW